MGRRVPRRGHAGYHRVFAETVPRPTPAASAGDTGVPRAGSGIARRQRASHAPRFVCLMERSPPVNRHRRYFWLGPLIALALAGAACGSPAPEPTAAPPPTDRPTATNAPPTKTPVPKDTATPSPEDLLPLLSDLYPHPSGAFAIGMPEGWDVSDSANMMYAESPDGS